MQEDVERIYAGNVRLTTEAYELVLHSNIDKAAVDRILRSDVMIVDADFIRSCIAEEAKIPSLPSHLPTSAKHIAAEVKKAEVQGQAAKEDPSQVEIFTKPTQAEANLMAKPAQDAASAQQKPPRHVSESIPAQEQRRKPLAIFSKSQPAQQKPQEQKPKPPAANVPATPPTEGMGSEEAKPQLQPEKSEEEKALEAEIARRKSFRPVAAEYSPRITIFERADVSGQSRCTGTVEDFVAHFRDRFQRISSILRSRPSNLIIARTDQLSMHQGEDIRLLCMVAEKRITSKGNLLLELEDEQGKIKAIVSSREQIFDVAKTILKDDVLAVDGRSSEGWFMVKTVTWPDIPIIREQKKADVDVAVAYLSDLHVGSRYFLEKPFRKFIRWLWGEEGNAELAGKVKYVCIAGDICDGIGVYPLQEKELVVKDIYEQYKMFDGLVEHFPDHIVTIVGPGNHDAVRRGEPQPYIPMDMIRSDVKKIGSPATLEIEGLKHLVYHGTSIDSIIANIGGLSYANPDGPMMEMLKRRHLSPIYGENLIVPEQRDYMLIEEEPDVVHMGHIHKNASRKYRGTLMINSGTFQERTEFQVKMGHVPTPGIVPILELQSGNLSHLNFLEAH